MLLLLQNEVCSLSELATVAAVKFGAEKKRRLGVLLSSESSGLLSGCSSSSESCESVRVRAFCALTALAWLSQVVMMTALAMNLKPINNMLQHLQSKGQLALWMRLLGLQHHALCSRQAQKLGLPAPRYNFMTYEYLIYFNGNILNREITSGHSLARFKH